MQNIHNDLDVSEHDENAGDEGRSSSGDLIGISDADSSEGDASVSESNLPVFNRPAVGDKQWNRTDAIRYLKYEFWLVDSGSGGSWPSFLKDLDALRIRKDRPRHGLYLELYYLVHKHYDEVEASDQQMTASDNSTTREARGALRNTVIAWFNGGWREDQQTVRHQRSLLPSQAEMMVSKFIDPYGDMDGIIVGTAASLGLMHLFSIDGGVDAQTDVESDRPTAAIANTMAAQTEQQIADVARTLWTSVRICTESANRIPQLAAKHSRWQPTHRHFANT
ncbi:hypothetical protein EDB82DRAFT_532362 [Fusarium venenatum]|uniref:uncharacterized protein n=1 Tax=Fusarium venenatum TaxID=56646 RepID=UPI001DDE2F67|nr:hypothetical protein EDB82DRAFT_532362 [Fusarium venenatum]